MAFVTVVAKLGESYREGIEEDVTQTSAVLFAYCMQFIILFNIWTSYTLYSTWFHTDDLFNKGFAMVLMFLVVILGMHSKKDGEKLIRDQYMYAVFAATLVFCLVIARSMWYIKRVRHMGSAWIVSSVAFICGSIGVMYMCPISYQPLGYGIVTIVTSNLQVGYAVRLSKENRIPLHLEHYIERFGLFTVIVIGECVTGVTVDPKDGEGFVFYGVIFFAVAIVLNMKMLYFDVDIVEENDHALRIHPIRGILWGRLHMLFALAIALMGSSLEVVLSSDQDSVVAVSRKTLAGSMATVLFILLVNRFLHRTFTACSSVLESEANEHGSVRCPHSQSTKEKYLRLMRVVYRIQVWSHIAAIVVTGASGFFSEEMVSNAALILTCAVVTSVVVVVNLLDEALSVGFMEK